MSEAADNVVYFDGITTLPINPEHMLRKAMERGLKEVVIVGFTEDGDHFFASSIGDSGNVLYHLIKAQWRLMKTEDELGGAA